MALAKEHTDFSLRELCTFDAKKVQIDRVFTNLLVLLKHDGAPITTVSRKRKMITIDDLVDSVCKDDSLNFDGFKENRDVVYKWLESNYLSLIHRGTDKQQVAAPLPMHLNVYKLRNSTFNRDYGVADQIFSMLYYGANDVMHDLRDFLFEGADFYTDKYDGQKDLDIETLVIMRILDQTERDYADDRKPKDIPVPLCLGQARILGDDIARLLAYSGKVPRLVLIDYIKSVLSLHTGLYLLRLYQIVPDLVKNGVKNHICKDCPVQAHNSDGFAKCAFPVNLVTDMGENYRSHMAELARQQYNEHIEQLNSYVKAHLTIKKLQEFGNELVAKGKIAKKPQSLEEILSLRDFQEKIEIKTFFEIRIRSLLSSDDDTTDQRLLSIRKMPLSEFDAYVEMVFLLRQQYHQKYYSQLMDSLFQKNTENGLMRQGYGKRNSRRYTLGSSLLETLVQIAVLEPIENYQFRTRSIRVDDFLEWIRKRYGIYIGRLPDGKNATITDFESLRLNIQIFKDRLREIGFYTDLSDAYISQVIRPRYYID
jgi:hypothetical protein